MSKIDKFALLLTLFSFFLSLFVANNVFETIPHLEDEIAYVWQANLAAEGLLTIQSPVCPECFLQPFIIDNQGVRYGKYPPGWPAALSLGIRLGVRAATAPFLGSLSVWLVYLLTKKIIDEKTAFLAVFLLTISPFFIMNAGSLLSHTWSLFLTAGFILAWLDTFSKENKIPKWITILTAGFCLGAMVLTRPLTALGVAFPFILHGIYILIKGEKKTKKHAVLIACFTLLISLLFLGWQYAVTGDPLQSPYTLYWPYDKIGFGPDVGLHSEGHTPWYAWVNTRFSLWVGSSDLFGWPRLSWLFLPFGLIALRKNTKALLVSSVVLSLILVYGLYWIGAWLLGPRYYFEGLISVVILSSSGFFWLAGKLKPFRVNPKNLFQNIRFAGVVLVLVLLVTGDLVFYLPQRLSNLYGLYGISSARLAPFLAEDTQELTPAIIIVHPQHNWLEYGGLLDLSNPFLDTPFIFTHNRSTEKNQEVADAFPERKVWHYYPDEPTTFYTLPK